MKNLIFFNSTVFLSILLISISVKPNTENNIEKTATKKAFVTGITGQDGSYLTELLLEKDYEVHGLIRRSSTLGNLDRLNGIKNSSNLILHYGDVTDANNVSEIIRKVHPDEIYNLAAQSHVQISFSMPEYTSLTNALGTLAILEAIRLHNLENKTKFYQASTSELFGKVQTVPQSERTPFYPRSPYGVAKLYAHWITINYRESYGIFACNGILFNHESPRRGENFVTRKITQAIAKIKYNLEDTLQLGNLDVKRDWGYAKDYVEAMWLILQHEKPDDYIIATGENHTVREFLELAFNYIGEEIVWQGEGVNEKGIDKKSGRLRVEINPQFFRPAEVVALIGDSSKAQKELGWKSKTSFKELVELMVQADCDQVKSELKKRSVKKEKNLAYED